MSSIVNLRTGLGPVLSLFEVKDRWTSPLIKARTVPTLVVSTAFLYPPIETPNSTFSAQPTTQPAKNSHLQQFQQTKH